MSHDRNRCVDCIGRDRLAVGDRCQIHRACDFCHEDECTQDCDPDRARGLDHYGRRMGTCPGASPEVE